LAGAEVRVVLREARPGPPGLHPVRRGALAVPGRVPEPSDPVLLAPAGDAGRPDLARPVAGLRPPSDPARGRLRLGPRAGHQPVGLRPLAGQLAGHRPLAAPDPAIRPARRPL